MLHLGIASTCAECGTQLTARADAAYCSNACRQQAYRNRKLVDWEATIARLKVNPKPNRNATAVMAKAEDTIRRLRERIKELEALEAQFEPRVQAEVQRILRAESEYMDRLRAKYQRVLATRNSILTRADYDLIRSCLHPDSRASASDQKLANAFRVFNEADILLLNEKDHPETVEDLLKQRRNRKR